MSSGRSYVEGCGVAVEMASGRSEGRRAALPTTPLCPFLPPPKPSETIKFPRSLTLRFRYDCLEWWLSGVAVVRTDRTALFLPPPVPLYPSK